MDKLQLHINSRIQQNITRQRQQFAMGNIGLDQKHDKIWCQFGYPEYITPEDLRHAEERQPSAKAAVARILSKTWQTMPEIIENEKTEDKINTPWEILINKIMRNAYPAIIDADKKNLINRYSAVIIKFRDSRPLDQEVDITALRRQKENAIAGYVPVWEEQIKPIEWDTDERSENYGKVLMWQFNEAAIGGDNDGAPVVIRNIHHSRVIILAEGSHDGNHSSGVSLLKAGFNSLIDMQKAQGGSAEGFLKNASRQLHVNYNNDGVNINTLAKSMGVEVSELKDALNNDVDALNSAIDAAMFTFGADVTPLSVTPADPTPTWTVAANAFSASVQLPFTILFGQQTGRLASDEDQTDYNMRGGARRENFINGIIKSFIDKYAEYGIIESKSDYIIKWDSLIEPSPANKADVFAKLATANKAVFESNLKPALTIDEMRQAAGYEPMGEDRLPVGFSEDAPIDEEVTK